MSQRRNSKTRKKIIPHWKKKMLISSLVTNPGYNPFPRPILGSINAPLGDPIGESYYKDIEFKTAKKQKLPKYGFKTAKAYVKRFKSPEKIKSLERKSIISALPSFAITRRINPTPRYSPINWISDMAQGRRRKRNLPWGKTRHHKKHKKYKKHHKTRNHKKNKSKSQKKRSLTASMKQLRSWLGSTDFNKLK
jgi:hypothetical protein